MTVPNLFSALVQLEISTRRTHHTIHARAARDHLAERNHGQQPRLREIAAAIARFFSLKLSDLRGPSRCRTVVTARNVAMYLARHLTQESLRQIGRYFGGRDHTTVMYGCRETENLLKSDPAIRQAIQRLQEKWQGT